MINGLEGIPGSGKSYEACVFQVLPALREGRKVITNLPLEIDAYAAIDPCYRDLIEVRIIPSPVRGTWNAARVDPETGKGQAVELWPDGREVAAPNGVVAFGHVWDYLSAWRHPKSGKGPLYIIDECHVMMPKSGTRKEVIEWFKLHRHFNVDVLLATQAFRDMNGEIARLMAMVIKVRKADVLGKSKSYIRKVHAGYRGAVIQQGVRDYESAFFKLYRSHTQGSAVLESDAADVAPLSVKLKRWTRLMWGACAIGGVAAYLVWKQNPPLPSSDLSARSAQAEEKRSSDVPATPAIESGPLIATAAPSSVEKPVEVGLPEPFAGQKLHLTGCMHGRGKVVCTFAVAADGRRVNHVTSTDLVAAGYRWEPRGNCVGWLHWGATVKAVVCDAPGEASGRDRGTPVVVERPVAVRVER